MDNLIAVHHSFPFYLFVLTLVSEGNLYDPSYPLDVIMVVNDAEAWYQKSGRNA